MGVGVHAYSRGAETIVSGRAVGIVMGSVCAKAFVPTAAAKNRDTLKGLKRGCNELTPEKFVIDRPSRMAGADSSHAETENAPRCQSAILPGRAAAVTRDTTLVVVDQSQLPRPRLSGQRTR